MSDDGDCKHCKMNRELYTLPLVGRKRLFRFFLKNYWVLWIRASKKWWRRPEGWTPIKMESHFMSNYLPTDINIIRPCHKEYSDNQPAFHFVVYWPSEAWRILFSSEIKVGVLLTSWWTICKYLSFHMKATYLPVHLMPFNFSNYAYVQFEKMHTQKCGNFEKIMRMTSFHIQFLCFGFRTCLNNANVSMWHFECSDLHWSADLTQRSRLFICVEINSWCMLSSSLASAVFWLSSAQFISGKSMSINQHYSHFSRRNPHYSCLQIAHMPVGGYLASKTLGR